MSIRLAVYQRENRPLDGLCAQLQSAGYDVVERYTEEATLGVMDGADVDALLIDAGADRTTALLATIKAGGDTSHVPVMLLAEEQSALLDDVAICKDVDEVVVLPILRNDLRSRVGNVARLGAMAAELKRRNASLSDFGVSNQVERLGPAAIERMQILLVGPMGDEQVAMIDGLDDAATFAYATKTDHAWHQLRQSYVDMVVVTSKVPPGELRQLCQRVRTTSGLTDLPLMVFDDLTGSPMIEAIARDENVDLLRVPFRPVALRKRLEVMVRQHRMKQQLRGMMTNVLHVSTVDNLTGLYGRGFLYHHLDRAIQESRERGEPLSVAICTIAGLAQVNDMLGYPVGDQLIGQLGRALVSSCRAQDLVARARGSSFCIVLNDTSEFEARAVCQRVAETLGRIIDQAEGHRLSQIDLALGMEELAAADTAETLITRALHQPTTLALRQAS